MGSREIHHVTVKKENPSQKWGFGITGGKDVALTFRYRDFYSSGSELEQHPVKLKRIGGRVMLDTVSH